MVPFLVADCGFAREYGLNVLDGKTYPHHPVMLQVPVQSYKIEAGLVTEYCGLKVPYCLDCRNLCNESHYKQFLVAHY